jgi:hypothetical protein
LIFIRKEFIMGLSLMGILKEDENRIMHGKNHISAARVQGLIRDGYKPYRIKAGTLVPLQKPAVPSEDGGEPKIPKFNLNFDFHSAKGDEDLTVYFLSDEELAKAQGVEERIKQIKEMYAKQILQVNNLLPSFIQHDLLGDVVAGGANPNV